MARWCFDGVAGWRGLDGVWVCFFYCFGLNMPLAGRMSPPLGAHGRRAIWFNELRCHIFLWQLRSGTSCQVTGCPMWADFCFKPLFSIQFTNRFRYLEVPKSGGDFRSPKWCQMTWLSFMFAFVSPFFSPAWRWRMLPDSKGRNIAFTPNSRAPRIWWNGSASGKINTGIK